MGKKTAIAFGANLGAREENIQRALALISERIAPVTACSSIIETPPLVPEGDSSEGIPSYLNGVAIIEQTLEPQELMAALLTIERELGRDRDGARRWQSRLIDLDIIAIGEERIERPGLFIPHPEMHKRDFVLVPLCELWPGWKHPVLEKSAQELLNELTGS